jgi:hypothetical protein
MDKDSKSDPECLVEELSSGTNTLVTINTDLELETTTQETTDNGSSLTGEQDPSELEPTETWLSLFNGEELTGSTITTLLL